MHTSPFLYLATNAAAVLPLPVFRKIDWAGPQGNPPSVSQGNSWSHSPSSCTNLCVDKGQEQQSRHRMLLGDRLDWRLLLLSKEGVFQILLGKNLCCFTVIRTDSGLWLLDLSGLSNSSRPDPLPTGRCKGIWSEYFTRLWGEFFTGTMLALTPSVWVHICNNKSGSNTAFLGV